MKIKRTAPIHNTITGYDFTKDEALTRATAIRAKCLECMCGDKKAIRECTAIDCGLWPYRSGRKRNGKN